MATLAPSLPRLPTAADPLRPQPASGTAPALSLALLAHAGLIAALALGTQWRASTPTVVSAELWASLPQVAAPRPATAPEPPPPPPAPVPAPAPAPAPPPPPPPPAVAPSPPPPDPQIAIEQQRRERQAREQREQQEREARARQERERQAREAQERQRAEAAARERAAEQQRQEAAERQRQEREQREQRLRAEAEARERAAEEARLVQQREEALRRIMGQAGASGTPERAGTAARDAAPSAAYAGRLVAHIKPRIVFAGSPPGNPEAVVEVRTGPAGTVIARRLVSSSGHREWDEAVLRAIDRAGTLPRDSDGNVPPVIEIRFRPLD
jgi:colicin import membrane protein